MNHRWIERLFHTLDPHYRPRHEIYNRLLSENLTKESVWIDIGCGRNESVAELGNKAKTAIGVDRLIDSSGAKAPFIQADLRNIPLPSSYAHLITLRMVVEHLERIPEDFSEIDRLLKPGGRVIILTTNRRSPLIALPRILPFGIKHWLLQKMFGVPGEDIFPTYHRFNTQEQMTHGVGSLKLTHLEFIEQLPLSHPWLTLIFWNWYFITKVRPFRSLKSNILAIFEKEVAT